MVTVLIPTTARPHLLRTALASVARQTARNRIGEVVVSENAGDPRSAEVCAEFPQLPITYVRRDPPLPALGHATVLFSRETPSTYTAVLHDDDWWQPDHLAQALAALDANPGASVYFSSIYHVTGESSPLSCDSGFKFWFGADYPVLDDLWVLPAPAAALACLLGTPGYYSALVARTAALRASVHVFDLGNPYDNDRLLLIALFRLGTVLFRPYPAVFIRAHPGQDQRTYEQDTVNRHMSFTTSWLFDQSKEAGFDLGALIEARIERCPAAHRETLFWHLSWEWCHRVLAERGIMPPALANYLAAHRPRSRLRKIAGEILPPALLSAASKIIHRSRPRA